MFFLGPQLQGINKKLLLAGAALLSLMTAASAADLAARPYTKAPPLSPGYNWSGFYIGVMGGGAWDSDNSGGFGGGTIGYRPRAASSCSVSRPMPPAQA
jgi:opacity protein-like surface antigen